MLEHRAAEPSLAARIRSALLVAALGAGGCVTQGITMARISDATAAVSSARQAGAAETDPYHYHLAVELLDKSRELAGRGEYQDAIDFAEASRTAAEAAVREGPR